MILYLNDALTHNSTAMPNKQTNNRKSKVTLQIEAIVGPDMVDLFTKQNDNEEYEFYVPQLLTLTVVRGKVVNFELVNINVKRIKNGVAPVSKLYGRLPEGT